MSYLSQGTIDDLELLKKRINNYKTQRRIKKNQEKRNLLEIESLNSSLGLEYPNNHKLTNGGKKLLKRLETAWEYSTSNIKKNKEISLRDIQVIQAIIVDKGNLGFRKRDVEINPRILEDLVEQINPPHYKKIDQLFEEMYEDLTIKAFHPVEEAAYIHLSIAFIHPFEDGNGRTARMIQNTKLHLEGYPVAITKPSERWHYFNLLQSAFAGLITGDYCEESLKKQQHFYEFIASKVIESQHRILED